VLAARELGRARLRLFRQSHEFQNLEDRTRRLVERGEELENLPHGELRGKIRFLELDSDALPKGPPAFVPALTENLRFAGVGAGESLEDLDGRGLPGPVGPEHAEARTRPGPQVHPVDRDQVAVTLDQATSTDGIGRLHGYRSDLLPGWDNQGLRWK
jgi:hypothetical protein